MIRTTASASRASEQPISWTELLKAPVYFVTTFAEPFTCKESRDFFGRQFVQLRDDVRKQGVLGYIGKAVRERPLDVVGKVGLICGAGSEHLGSVLGGSAHLVLSLVKTAGAYAQQVEFFKEAASSVDGRTILQKGIKITLYGGMMYLISALPAAAAKEWNSIADARDHYSGGPCSNSVSEKMGPAKQCIEAKQGSFQECSALVPKDFNHDVTSFTRHGTKIENSDPVSIITFKGRTCIFSALNPDSDVTKICFTDPKNLDARTVEKVTGMSLVKTHAGLKPGETVVLLEMGPTADLDYVCASFRPVKPDYTLPPDVCVLTALEKGGPVSQLCFSPDNPTALTLKPRPGIKLDQPGQEGPVSIVIQDPVAEGLNVAPEAPCPEAGKIAPLWDRLWGALNWIWTGKSPCDKTNALPGKQEL